VGGEIEGYNAMNREIVGRFEGCKVGRLEVKEVEEVKEVKEGTIAFFLYFLNFLNFLTSTS
jgi:hypothetical protein